VVATTQGSLGQNCCLTALGPNVLSLEPLEVADEHWGQRVKFSLVLFVVLNVLLTCGSLLNWCG